MSAQSGITPAPELLAEWDSSRASSAVRALKIEVKGEHLVLSDSIPASSNADADWALLEPLLKPHEPSYVLFHLDGSQGWLFYALIPDSAAVRSKMIYASTRATLYRALGGDGAFVHAISATAPSELTSSGYASFLRRKAMAAPLTEREKDLIAIKEAEAEARANPNVKRSMLGQGSGFGLPWAEDAQQAVTDLKAGGVVALEIEKEKIVLSSPQPSTLSVSSTHPSYTFYRSSSPASHLVFIYTCPPSSPIRSRLIYSSSAGPAVQYTKSTLSLDVAKKLETSSSSEVTVDWVESELKDLPAPAAPVAAPAFVPSGNNDTSGRLTSTIRVPQASSAEIINSSVPLVDSPSASSSAPSTPGIALPGLGGTGTGIGSRPIGGGAASQASGGFAKPQGPKRGPPRTWPPPTAGGASA